MALDAEEPPIKLEGQKVLFDKKVGLMPANIRKEAATPSRSEKNTSRHYQNQ